MQEIGFGEICKALKGIKLPKFKLVVGIANGGIVPAGLVAYKLGCGLRIIRINYRGEDNKPQRQKPVILSKAILPLGIIDRILLVDDVSVTGKTLREAKKLFRNYEVRTFVLRGKADYVLFPNIDSCVKWPWRDYEK